MHVFQIKGLSGLLMFLLGVAAILSVFVVFPTSFMMVLWNAVIFEGFQGPEIGMAQALLLWSATLLALYLALRPQFSLQFKRVNDPQDMENQIRDLKNKEHKE